MPTSDTKENPVVVSPQGLEELVQINQEIYEKNAQLVTHNRTLSTLKKIYDIINASQGIDETASYIVREILNELDFELGLIYVTDDKKEFLKSIACEFKNVDPFVSDLRNIFSNARLDLNDENILSTKSILTKQILSHDDPGKIMGVALDNPAIAYIRNQSRINAFTIYPIRFGSDVGGILILGSTKDAWRISPTNQEILNQIIDIIGIGLQNSRLYTQTKMQIAELELRNKQLEEYAQKERDILDIMGHELRTPITIVRNSLMLVNNMFKDKDFENPKFGHYLDVATRSTNREMNIIETMHAATKIEANKIELQRTELNTRELIDEALEGQRQNAIDKGLALNVEIPENVSNIYADRSRILEVLDNFLSNAVKYTNQGSVTIKIEDEEGLVKFSIIDSGIGIAEEDIAKLGIKFYRVDQHVSADFTNYSVVRPGGTGLGLYVTFSLVKLHGGGINVISEVGKGSTFAFTLPKYTNQPKQDGSGKSKDLLEEYRRKKANI